MSGKAQGNRGKGARPGGGARRLFIALDLPEEMRTALAALSLMLPLPRRAAEETLHLTLVFLGMLDVAAAQEVDAELSALRAAPFDLALQGVGLFGGARPRAVWAGAAPCPALMELQAKVAGAARRAGVAPEARRFVPHVTLGRFPPGHMDAPRLEAAIAQAAGFRAGPWRVDRFTLYDSHLHPDGARHTALADYSLGA